MANRANPGLNTPDGNCRRLPEGIAPDGVAIRVKVDEVRQNGDLPPVLDRLGEGNSTDTARTANPVQTSAIFRVWKGISAGTVDAGFPLQHDNFSLRRALSSAG